MTPFPDSFISDSEAYHVLLQSAEDLVKLQQPEPNEIREQRRILRDCHKAFSRIPVLPSEIKYSSLLKNARHRLLPTTEDPLLSAEKYPLYRSSVNIKSYEDENILLFWKNAFEVPFGPTLGKSIVKNLDSAVSALQSTYTPPKPPSSDKRHNEAKNTATSSTTSTSSVQKPGICGLWHFAWWFAQGQSKSKAPVISAHLIDTAYKNAACIRFFNQLAPNLQILGLIYQIIDPQDYWNALSRVRVTRSTSSSSWSLYTTSRRFAFHGVAVLRNLRVLPHRDSGDRKDGYTMMMCAGTFTGGYLVVPDSKIRIDFKPGDIIIFRAALLEHYLTDFEGDRTSFVFFNHQNIWDYTKLV